MEATIIARMRTSLRRACGVSFGFANQLLFLVTVWSLFWFLRDGSISTEHDNWALYDSGLAILFAVAHSAMLAPSIRRRLSTWIPHAFYDSLFCTVTCVTLLALFFLWRTSELAVWQLSGWAETAIRIPFYASWAALIYSLWLTGLGYQNGWTPFYYWLRRRQPPRRQFKPRGAYTLIRHPVYMSFLGLVWFTPRMTLDHAVLTGIWTAYIFYGSFLKDRRLERFIGEPYKRYQAKVPGYPLIPMGPLARRSEAKGGRFAERTSPEPTALAAVEDNCADQPPSREAGVHESAARPSIANARLASLSKAS